MTITVGTQTFTSEAAALEAMRAMSMHALFTLLVTVDDQPLPFAEVRRWVVMGRRTLS